jgi:hypothetical protein
MPACHSSHATGIGQVQIGQSTCDVMIQATTDQTPTPLQAEAMALLLAVVVAQELQLQQRTFLTDNVSLAAASATQSITARQVPWEIRDILSSFFPPSAPLQAAIYHVKRNLNEVAHDCAHQAIKANATEPTFRCNCSAHRNSRRPIFIALHSTNFTGYVLHSVYCT